MPVRGRLGATASAPLLATSLLALLVVGLGALGALLTPAVAASAATRLVTFGIQPATASAPDGRPFLSYGVTPGATLRDHVAVLNYSAVPLTLSVYATDALNTANGGLGLLPADRIPVDAGAWVSLGSDRISLTVPPRTAAAAGRVVLPVSVTVPATATPGDHVGGIVASLATFTRNAQGANVELDQRIATRLFVRVSGPLRPHLAVDGLSASYHGTGNPFGRGTVTMTYTVHNDGNVKLGGRQEVEIAGLLGSTRAVAPADIPLLIPGGSKQMTVQVTGVLPAVWMTATVRVVPTKLASDSDPSLGVVTTATHFWAVPWTALLLVLLLGGGGFGGYRYRRRRAARAAESGPEAPPAPPTSKKRPALVFGVLTLLGVLGVLLLGPAAYADTGTPYTDPNATGVIGLCDKAGHAVTHGNIHDAPFVWRAVSSTPAPAPYDAAGRTATLYAFQPRPSVPPGQWSGDSLTAAARYTDAAHPMAQATGGDERLADFLGAYPTMVDGLLQLRIYLGAPGEPLYGLKYAATDIKVTGDTWTVVHGGAVPCTTGSAVSLETIVLPAKSKSASPLATPAGTPSTVATPPAVPTAAAASAGSASTADASSSTGGRTGQVALGLAVIVILGGGVAVLLRARRGG